MGEFAVWARDIAVLSVAHGKKVRITMPDLAASRLADLLQRQFSLPAPDRLDKAF